MKDVKPNQLIYVKEGEGIVRTVEFDRAKGKVSTRNDVGLQWISQIEDPSPAGLETIGHE